MPRRRVRSAAQIAAQRKATIISARVRAVGQPISFPSGKRGEYTPPGHGGRRTKQGGKSYVKKSGSSVTIAPAVAQMLAGAHVTASLKDFHPSTIRGDVVQTHSGPYRKQRKAK